MHALLDDGTVDRSLSGANLSRKVIFRRDESKTGQIESQTMLKPRDRNASNRIIVDAVREIMPQKGVYEDPGD